MLLVPKKPLQRLTPGRDDHRLPPTRGLPAGLSSPTRCVSHSPPDLTMMKRFWAGRRADELRQNCEKLHYIAPQIWCAGAGTAADTEFTTALVSSQLELHSLSTGRKPRVVTCMTMLKQHLFRHQGHIGAYLVVAGVDATGVGLFTVHAHGSTDKLPYVTMGSGSLAAMSVFETQWRPKLTRDGAVELAATAIKAGIFNDLGSGSNVDVCVITSEKASLLRGYITPNQREQKQRRYLFKRGTTAVLNERVIARDDISKYVTVQEIKDGVEPQLAEKMELDT